MRERRLEISTPEKLTLTPVFILPPAPTDRRPSSAKLNKNKLFYQMTDCS